MLFVEISASRKAEKRRWPDSVNFTPAVECIHIQRTVRTPTDWTSPRSATYNTRFMSQTLSTFLQPKCLAIVGASARPESVGHALLRNLILQAPADRVAEVFAVNPKGGEIDGCRVYKSLAEIGQNIDLIVVAIPPRFIPDLMTEAAAVGVRAAIIISAGFGETGKDGQALQDQLLKPGHASIRSVCWGPIAWG